MKNVLILSVLLFSFSVSIIAQGRYEINYDVVESDELRMFFEFKDIEYIKIDLSGNLDGKKGKIRETICRNGKTEFKDYAFYYPMDEDTLNIQVMLGRIDDDKIDLFLKTPYRNVRSIYEVRDNGQYVPLDINLKEEEKVLPTVPVIGITNGLIKKVIFNEEEGTSHDFCGIRDEQLHPSEWHTLPDLIDDYVYFEIIFE